VLPFLENPREADLLGPKNFKLLYRA